MIRDAGAAVEVDGARRKRKRVRLVQRYVINPWTKLAAHMGLAPGCVLLETTGRTTGTKRRTVVGMHVEDGTGWVVAEQGHHAGYVRNLEADPHVRVRLRGGWREGRAETVPDDDAQARLDSFGRPGHAKNVRRFGTALLTVRVDLDPTA